MFYSTDYETFYSRVIAVKKSEHSQPFWQSNPKKLDFDGILT